MAAIDDLNTAVTTLGSEQAALVTIIDQAVTALGSATPGGNDPAIEAAATAVTAATQALVTAGTALKAALPAAPTTGTTASA